MSRLYDHARKFNSRILESSVQFGSDCLGSREEVTICGIEEEVDIVKDRVNIIFIRPLMRDHDGVRGRIEGDKDCKKPMSVECPSRRCLGEGDTYTVGFPRYHHPRQLAGSGG